MKYVKKIFLVVVLILSSSCSSIHFYMKMNEEEREKNITSRYNILENKYYKILEDELKIKDLENLEGKFINLEKDIFQIDKKNISENHSLFLKEYIEKIKLKLQYLNDLKL